MSTHQALDPATRRSLTGAHQRLPGAPVAVGLVVFLVRRSDPRQQPLVLDLPGRALAGGALVVGGRRHVQGLADGLDAEAATMLVDVAAHFGRSGSSSLAKNTLADFKISFALRSSKFSRRSLRTSSRSWVVRMSPRLPLSASARLTRFRNVSRWIPRSSATCAIGRPLSSARRTPRSINSYGYFAGLGITTGSPFPRTKPRNKAPVNTGLAQIAARWPPQQAPEASGYALLVRTRRTPPLRALSTTTPTSTRHLGDISRGHAPKSPLPTQGSCDRNILLICRYF